LDPKV